MKHSNYSTKVPKYASLSDLPAAPLIRFLLWKLGKLIKLQPDHKSPGPNTTLFSKLNSSGVCGEICKMGSYKPILCKHCKLILWVQYYVNPYYGSHNQTIPIPIGTNILTFIYILQIFRFVFVCSEVTPLDIIYFVWKLASDLSLSSLVLLFLS